MGKAVWFVIGMAMGMFLSLVAVIGATTLLAMVALEVVGL